MKPFESGKWTIKAKNTNVVYKNFGRLQRTHSFSFCHHYLKSFTEKQTLIHSLEFLRGLWESYFLGVLRLIFV